MSTIAAVVPTVVITTVLCCASRCDTAVVPTVVGTAVNEYGFRGIKVHRHDARLTREICDVAREYRLPILYDVMGEVSAVELLASEYPDVNFIIPHLGSFGRLVGARRDC